MPRFLKVAAVIAALTLALAIVSVARSSHRDLHVVAPDLPPVVCVDAQECPPATPYPTDPIPTTTTTEAPPVTTTTQAPAPPPAPAPAPVVVAPRPVVFGTGACGGSLPPCFVLARESGGNLTAVSPAGYCANAGEGGHCYGKWQFGLPTWGGWGGYANPIDAPESVQDDRARAVWAGGAGCSAWAAC